MNTPRLIGWVLLLAILLAAALFLACGDNDDDDETGAPAEGDDDDVTPPDADPWAGLSPTGPVVADVLGVSSHVYTGPDASWTRNFELEMLAGAGMMRLRRDFHWSAIEPADDDWHFERVDTLVDLAEEQGFRLDALLCYGVDWARTPGFDSEINPADFADFAGRVAGRYCGRIDTYEIWNEQNISRFWKPEPDPYHYGLLLKAAYQAIKRACPEAQVVFGGISSFDSHIFWLGMWNYLERVHREHPDIGACFDALAIHPYTLIQHTPPEDAVQMGDALLWPDLTTMIRIARDRLAAMHNEWMPILITEMGWPSLLISESDQAAWLARAVLLSLREGVEGYYWYTFWDGDGQASLPTEDHFGLFTYPYAEGEPRPKPAYRTARAVGDLLGGSRYAGDLSDALNLPEGVHALAFVEEDAGDATFAGWDARPGGETWLALPCPEGRRAYRVFDDEGLLLFEGSGEEPLLLELTGHVLYVRFEK